MQREVEDVQTELYREIAEETLEAAYFDFQFLNARPFLDKIRKVYTFAQQKEADAALTIAVLMSTRARI